MPGAVMLAALWLLSSAAGAAEPSLELKARAVKQGEIVLVAVEGHDPRREPEASFQGRPLAFSPGASTGTWLSFLGLDVETATGPATLTARLRDPAGKTHKLERAVTIEAGAFPVQELKVEQKFVTPEKSDAERAEAEASRLHGLFLRGEEKRLFDGKFDAPIAGAASGRFGERRVFNGQPRAPHSGMDLRARRGVPVKAPAAGRVVLAGPLFFSGNTVVLDHGLGLTTLYAHLSTMTVKPGDMVKKGAVLGKVGATGRVTGPHLHWGLKLKTARVDPYSLTALDLDAYLKPRKRADALVKSPACERVDLPPPGPWGPLTGGLRARTRSLGDAVLVEIYNSGKKNAFLDFVRDPAQRTVVLGLNGEPSGYAEASGGRKVGTEQVKIPPRRSLCFEQPLPKDRPLPAGTTTWPLVYDTANLYSTATVRTGIWHGRLEAP